MGQWAMRARRAMVGSIVLWTAGMAGSTPFDRLPRDGAGAIVRRAIEHAGGWPAWASKKTVQYRLTTRTLGPGGSVLQTRVESHRDRLQPQLGVRIEWEQGGKSFVLINNGRFAAKVADGSEDFTVPAGREARDATFRAHYDLGMPFKLTDPGTHLEDLGPAPLEKGTPANRVRVTYDTGVGDAGGLHTWTYFFEPKTGRLLATLLQLGPGQFEFTEDRDEREFGGLRLATKRIRYAADGGGKKGPPISESLYENVQFNVPLDDVLFAIPPR